MVKQNDIGDYFLQLLTHETYRVYSDRLVSDEDRYKFSRNIIENMFKLLRKEIPDPESIIFSEINDDFTYLRVESIENIKQRITEHIDDYNYSKRAKDKIDLILFDYSLRHLLRIDRILSRQSEHAVLIGLTGSGRQSLANIAGFIKKFKIFKIRGRDEVEDYTRKEWLEDLRNLYTGAGFRKEPTIFLVRDSNIKLESFYVDLNCVISSGIVYNLFSSEEKSEMIAQIKSNKESNEDANLDEQFIWDSFIVSTMQRLRVFMCLNPLDVEFTKRLRTFPALINNTTIDWYEAWPESALYFLAEREFTKSELIADMSETMPKDLSEIFSRAYLSLGGVNEDYEKLTRRKVFILPKAFLDFIQFFLETFSKLKSTLEKNILKYSNGVKQIEMTGVEIKKMTELLEKKKPDLVIKNKYLGETLQEMEVQKAEANESRIISEEKGKVAHSAQTEAQYKKKIAEINRLEAENLQQEINKKISQIDKKQFYDLRGIKNPTKQVLKMMQAIGVIKSSFDKHPLETVPTAWSHYQKILNDVKFLNFLLESPKKLNEKQFSEKILKHLTPFIGDPDLDPTYMETKISFACGCFASYIKNMYLLDDALKNKIIPSNIAEAEATASLETAQKNLEETMTTLKIIEDKLDSLQRSFDEKQMEKNDLIFEINESTKKLQIAQRLTSKLSGEMGRWAECAESLEKGRGSLFGDIIVSSFYISFMGPYLSYYREGVIKENIFSLLNEVS